jgi:hypothetical protein
MVSLGLWISVASRSMTNMHGDEHFRTTCQRHWFLRTAQKWLSNVNERSKTTVLPVPLSLQTQPSFTKRLYLRIISGFLGGSLPYILPSSTPRLRHISQKRWYLPTRIHDAKTQNSVIVHFIIETFVFRVGKPTKRALMLQACKSGICEYPLL